MKQTRCYQIFSFALLHMYLVSEVKYPTWCDGAAVISAMC